MTTQHDGDIVQLRRRKIQREKRGEHYVRKREKILKRLSEIVPNLPDSKKERLLGVAEGMNIMKESMETQKAG